MFVLFVHLSFILYRCIFCYHIFGEIKLYRPYILQRPIARVRGFFQSLALFTFSRASLSLEIKHLYCVVLYRVALHCVALFLAQ